MAVTLNVNEQHGLNMDLEHFTITELLNRCDMTVTFRDLAAVLPAQKVFDHAEAQAILEKAATHATCREAVEKMARILSGAKNLPHYHDPMARDYVYVLTYHSPGKWNFVMYEVSDEPSTQLMPGTVLDLEGNHSTLVFLARHVDDAKNTLPFSSVIPMFGQERVRVNLHRPIYDDAPYSFTP